MHVCVVIWQVDTLRPGLLGSGKEEFAQRYCDRRLVPACLGREDGRKRWDNSGAALMPMMALMMAGRLECIGARVDDE